MFLLDSLMISGIRWTLETVATAAEAEMNDDSALRDRLMEAEMRREMGAITDAEFAVIEADLLRAIREIKERRGAHSGALAFAAGQPIDAGADATFQDEAEISGDFHGDPARPDEPGEPSTRTVDATPGAASRRTPDTGRTSRTTRTARATRATRST